MKKMIMIAALALISSGASAAFDFANPDSITKITAAQLQTLSGDASAWAIRGVGADNTGNFLAISGNTSATSGLWSVNPVSVTGTEVIGHADLVAASGAGTTSLAINRIVSRPDGAIMIGQFTGVDDLIRVTTGPATAMNITEADGTAGIALSPDGATAYIGRETSFLALVDEVVTVPTAGGAVTTLASAATIMTASGATGVALAALVTLANGNIVAWDDAAFGGSDKALQFTPAGAVSILFDPTTEASLGSSAAGYTSGASDSNGNLFFFDEFNANAALSDSVVIRDSAGVFTRITAAQINTAIGAGTFEFKTMGAYSTATEVRLFAADDEADGIVVFTWTELTGPAAAGQWSIYE